MSINKALVFSDKCRPTSIHFSCMADDSFSVLMKHRIEVYKDYNYDYIYFQTVFIYKYDYNYDYILFSNCNELHLITIIITIHFWHLTFALSSITTFHHYIVKNTTSQS